MLWKVNILPVLTAWSKFTVLVGSSQEDLDFHCTATFSTEQYRLKLPLNGDRKDFQYM